jgi:hypothetical protein
MSLNSSYCPEKIGNKTKLCKYPGSDEINGKSARNIIIFSFLSQKENLQ